MARHCIWRGNDHRSRPRQWAQVDEGPADNRCDGWLVIQGQAFLRVHAIETLLPDLPAFPQHQHAEATIAKPHARLRQLPHALAQPGQRIPAALIPQARSPEACGACGAPLADTVASLLGVMISHADQNYCGAALSKPDLFQHGAQYHVGTEVPLRKFPRGLAVSEVIGIHRLDVRHRLFDGAERQQSFPGRNPALETS